MEKLLQSPFRKFDLIIPITSLILATIGLSTIYSTIIANSAENSVLTNNLINIQLLAITSGVLVFALISFLNYRYLTYLAPVLYLLIIASLVGILVFAPSIRGSARWFNFGPINLQPSTIGAVLLVVVFSAYFAAIGEKINKIHFLGLGILMYLIPAGLLLAEPDLGITIIVTLIWFGLLHLTPIKLSRLIPIYLVILLVIPFGWKNLADYQKDRILFFISPASDPLGSGYHSRQSIIAVGSGGLFGRGWGRGTQSHLQFLPEQHTDFIFATFAEEQGFVGTIIILFLYSLIIWRMRAILSKTKDYFGQLLTAGVIFWLSLHLLINIGMNLGIAPITGIPLPLLSYGGTAIVSTFLALGLIESVAIHQTDW